MDGTTPAITHVMEPVLPGAYAVLTVGGMSDDSRIYAFRLADQPAMRPGEGKVEVSGEAVELPIAQRTGECLTVDVPPGDLCVYALSLSDAFDPGNAVIVNRPRLDWTYPAAAACGRAFRVIGRNLVSADNYPTADPAEPASFGGLLEGKTRIVARRSNRGEFVEIPVLKSSAYEAYLQIPEDLDEGDYEVFAHNGLGGVLGWSDPFAIKVQKETEWPSDVFRADEFIEQEDEVSKGIAAALAALGANGGGVLEFGAGVYPIRETLVLPPRTRLCGAGMNRTMLNLPRAGGPIGPYVAITGDGDFIVEDLRIHSVYAPMLICAPTFVPATFDEAFDIPFNFAATRARNVSVRRCLLRQRINEHIDRRQDADGDAWKDRMQQYVLSQGQGHSGFAGVRFRGDDLAVEDCVIWGGGSCVTLPGCSHVRVANNTLRPGPTGHAVYAIGRLNWPEDGTGARIYGNYASEILIEDNDINAYSERARDLVYFIYGAENGHVARNRIVDIEATFDAEGLGCHLWSAVWTEPSIRMTGLTTAEILDPTGEVAHEWLEGACLYIVDGCGVGQLRRILERDGKQISIDRPWIVDPDESSNVVFMAPPPFNNMTFVDNHIENTGINIIVWGNSRDIVIDGNYSADAAGITVWSVRLAADQKVWGGAAFSTIMHNTTDIGWHNRNAEKTIGGATGIFNPCSRDYTCTEEGFDFLGLVIRDNLVKNDTGIGIRITFPVTAADGTVRSWRINHAGIVVENNRCVDCAVGVAIEEGANAVERANTG